MVSDDWQIQTGDPTGTGSGGESFWGTPFRDEHDLKGAGKHDKRGVISMANKGANTNGLAPLLIYDLVLELTPHLTWPFFAIIVPPFLHIGGERSLGFFVPGG